MDCTTSAVPVYACLLYLFISLAIPAYAAGFEVINTDNVIIKHEEGLGGVSSEIAGVFPVLRYEVQERAGLQFNFPVRMVIYGHRETFLSAAGSDMVAAFAVPGQDLIVLDYSQFRYDSLKLKMIIMHEMCHLLLHKYIAGGNLPRWFDEGMSQWISGGINELIYPRPADALQKAIMNDALLPFSAISDTLPSDPERLILSYEQGKSMVDYIERSYGRESLKKIIKGLSQGADFSDVVRKELGIEFTGLEKKWKTEKARQELTWLAYISDHIYLILFILTAFLTLYGYIRLRKKMSEYKDEEI